LLKKEGSNILNQVDEYDGLKKVYEIIIDKNHFILFLIQERI
jgi:hypothetical protein